MKLDHLSYSSINTYLTCSRNWAFKYITQVPVQISPNLIFGSAWHNTVEDYIAGKAIGKPVDLLATWQEKWDEQASQENIYWDIETPEELCKVGVRWVTGNITSDTGEYPSMAAFLDTIKPTKTKEGIMIEKKITLTVPGVPIPIIGYIDIVSQDGIPGDFKTSSRSWSQGKAQDELQTLFYLAALNQSGQPVKGGKFRHYIFVKNKTPKVQVLEHSHKMKEMLFLFRTIRNVWKGINSEVYIENPGSWLCSPKFCDFHHLCRGKYV